MRGRIIAQVVAAALVIAGSVAALLPFTSVDGFFDDAAAAARVEAFGAADFSRARVVILALDEKSVDDERLRAAPRALMSPIWAELAQTALDHGATGVGVDFILGFDAAAVRIDGEAPLKSYDGPMLRLLRTEGRAGRVTIGRSRDLTPTRRFSTMAGEKGLAFIDLDTDPDGVGRRIRPRFTRLDSGSVTTLSGALLSAAGAPATEEIRITPPAALSDLPSASVIDVLLCDDEAALRRLFEGRSVLIGGALPDEDRFRAPDRFMASPRPAPLGPPCAFPTPSPRGIGGDLPGVWLHAAAVDAHVGGWALSPARPWTAALIGGIAGAIAAWAGLALGPAASGAVALGVGAIGFAAAAAAQELGVLWPAARPALGALIGFASGWAGRLLFLDRRARALRASFGRYVAPELVERILEQEKLPELDGEQRPVAIMFADLSGFTALSEQVDGKTLTATVNKYLSLIAREVEASGGYVDKFIGDAVMAIWNAPADLEDFERSAVRAAVAIRDKVELAGAADAALGLPNFAVKVGVNSGLAIVGNVGDEYRLNYTAVGDTVNIAARMEGLPSVFATPVVLGETCARAADAEFPMLEFASIQVKGRQEPVAVFAPLERNDRDFFDVYAIALAAYRGRSFAEAADRWRTLAGVDWSASALCAVMAGLADDAAADPPGAGWSGAVIMSSK